MFGRETISSFQAAADSVTETSDALREHLPYLAQLNGEVSYMAEDVKTAAQSATITLALVGAVAVFALVAAVVALRRTGDL